MDLPTEMRLVLASAKPTVPRVSCSFDETVTSGTASSLFDETAEDVLEDVLELVDDVFDEADDVSAVASALAGYRQKTAAASKNAAVFIAAVFFKVITSLQYPLHFIFFNLLYQTRVSISSFFKAVSLRLYKIWIIGHNRNRKLTREGRFHNGYKTEVLTQIHHAYENLYFYAGFYCTLRCRDIWG